MFPGGPCPGDRIDDFPQIKLDKVKNLWYNIYRK